MLELFEVSKQFGSHPAVSEVSLKLEPGDFLGLIGPNGAGKSTTIKMMVGHLRPTSGRILIGGHDIAFEPLQARRSVGYVPEYVTLYEYLTGLEYLDFTGELKGLSSGERQDEIQRLLNMLELGEERDRLIRTYSQGMRRKVALAGAMLGRPPVLVLDEALNGLDPATSHRIKHYLRELSDAGVAILLSSHILEVLERICNRAVVMYHGSVVERLDAADLNTIRRQEGGLERHFLSLIASADQTSHPSTERKNS